MKQRFYKPKGPIDPGLSKIADALTEVLKVSELAMLLMKGKRSQQARAVRAFLRATRRARAHATRLRTFIEANNTYWDGDNEGGGYIYPPETFYAIIARADQYDAAMSDAIEAFHRVIGGAE